MTLAHGVTTPADVWSAWSFDPLLLLGLVGAGVLYARGSARLPHDRKQRVAFYGGLAALFLALVTPLDAVSEALFSAHMGQHLVLIFVAAPLLVMGAPGVHLALALPPAARRLWHRLVRTSPARLMTLAGTNLVIVWCVHAVAVWAWHLPGPYEAALRNDFVHAFEHVSFAGTAMLFWATIVRRTSARVGHAGTILFVFATALQGGALGALLIFANRVLYPIHDMRAHDWGLTAIEDQQLAGALMWIPPGFVYFIVMAVTFAKWLRHIEQNPLAVGSGEP
jgi:putative membrane protein